MSGTVSGTVSGLGAQNTSGIWQGFLGGYTAFLKISVGFELALSVEVGAFRLAECRVPLFDHGVATVFIYEREVHAESKAGDVLEF